MNGTVYELILHQQTIEYVLCKGIHINVNINTYTDNRHIL